METTAASHGPAQLRTDHDPKAFALAFVNTYDPLRPIADLFASPEHARVFLSEWCEMNWDLDWGKIARRLQLYRDDLRNTLTRYMAGALPLDQLTHYFDHKLMHWPWIAHCLAKECSFRVVFVPSPQLQPVQHIEAVVTRGIADLIAEFGPERLRQCESPPCEEIFIDRSKSRRRRFCGKRCATRFNVAMFRKRQAS
jgi:hypothetical protein